jgi:acetyl esterase/lipase
MYKYSARSDVSQTTSFLHYTRTSLIVHGDADTAVPIDQGETMYAALTKAGVPASFIRIKGAGHGFEGAAPADLERGEIEPRGRSTGASLQNLYDFCAMLRISPPLFRGVIFGR